MERGAVIPVEVDALPATVLARADAGVKVSAIVPAAFEPVSCIAVLASIAVSLPQSAWTVAGAEGPVIESRLPAAILTAVPYPIAAEIAAIGRATYQGSLAVPVKVARWQN